MIEAEDCEARSLLKGQRLKLKEIGDNDEAWKREHGGEDNKADEDDKIQGPKLSEYERQKAKNIAEIKKILAVGGAESDAKGTSTKEGCHGVEEAVLLSASQVLISTDQRRVVLLRTDQF